MKKKMYVAPQVEEMQLKGMHVIMAGSTPPPGEPSGSGGAPKKGAPIP